MSIIKEYFYACKCDVCGEINENSEGYSFWADENNAGEEAMNNDWIEHEGKDVCDNCYTIDDKDNVIIKARS